MLEELRIRGLGVIDDAVLELAPGLTVITGETGAGKTMVVHGLGLLFGSRADAARVRPGHRRAVVEGRLAAAAGSTAAALARDAGAELDVDALLLMRSVTADGRSRASVGGAAVPVGVLVRMADDLVAVHGQSQQSRLVRPGSARELLDGYAGGEIAVVAAAYHEAYLRLNGVSAELAELRTAGRERAREADLLRFGLAEVDRVAPVAGEEVDLALEVARLGGADALRAAAVAAHELLVGGEESAAGGTDAVALVAAARHALAAVGDGDPEPALLAARLAEAGYLLADVAADAAGYAAALEADPLQLAAAQDRQAQLSALFRKYGEDTAAVLSWAAAARDRLTELDGDDGRRVQLESAEGELTARLGGLASQLSGVRQATARRFSAAVAEELTGLAMPAAAIEVAVGQQESAAGIAVGGRRVAFGPHGVDDVEMLLRPHHGAPARPVAQGASGGELSRVMLAVEVVLAAADPVPTMVFDEVDAGVGGRAAVEVGRRLARLALSHQVIVVTHLPQVAAFADRHLRVVKTDDGTDTVSGVRALDDAGRVRELSRMLAGQEGSVTAVAHAEELLAAAAAAAAAASRSRPPRPVGPPAPAGAAAASPDTRPAPTTGSGRARPRTRRASR